MALGRKRKPETAPDLQQIAASHAADLDAAYARWREAVLESRKRAIRGAKKAGQRGELILPLSLVLGAVPPEQRPATWGKVDGATADTGPMIRDRDGRPVRTDESGRIVSDARTILHEGGTEEIVMDFPAGPKTITVSTGRPSGDQPARESYRVDQAAILADLHGISLAEAREWIAAQAEDE